MKEIHKFVLAGVLCGASCLYICTGIVQERECSCARTGGRFAFPAHGGRKRSVCCVLLRLVFLVWALINIIMEMRRSMELSVRGALPFFRKLLDWRRLGIRCCSKKWLLSFLMKRVPVGMNWIREEIRKEQFSDVLTFWSPTVNMARDPRWGRTPETYGEDPFLSGVMGTAFL